jgi:DNA replication protein DnaC
VTVCRSGGVNRLPSATHRELFDNFDFSFNPKMNRSLVFDLATCTFIGKREDALFLGPGGTGKSHLAQAIGQAAIQQGHRVLYGETHVLLDDLAEAVADGTRKEFMESLTTVPLLIIDDFGMRKLPMTAAEDLLEIVMRRYERASTLLTSNRPVEDWGKLLGDVAAVSAMLDRLLHHGHVLKCGPRSWRTKSSTTGNDYCESEGSGHSIGSMPFLICLRSMMRCPRRSNSKSQVCSPDRTASPCAFT